MHRPLQGVRRKSLLVGDEPYLTYIPHPLPPVPAVDLAAVAPALSKATLAVGELNGVVENPPSPHVLNYIYVRKEAVLSSQIEGTQSTLDDLLRYESGDAPGVPVDDVTEVSGYVAALNHGMERLAGGFPLSLRLIREIHEILLTNARGMSKTPGRFRTSQNWIERSQKFCDTLDLAAPSPLRDFSPNRRQNSLPVELASKSKYHGISENAFGGTRPGNARFVPAPPDRVPELMGDLEKFIHDDSDRLPLPVKAALIHQQFETIHPFLDGNGRVGRLLITLYLCERGFLKSPFLYLSLFFKRHRALYYEKLGAVRATGDWEDWLAFFLEGVAETAADAKAALLAIRALFARDDERVAGMGRARVSAAAVLAEFKRKPLLSIAELTERTGLAKSTAIGAVNRLTALGVLRNGSGRKWGQIYLYEEYMGLLR